MLVYAQIKKSTRFKAVFNQIQISKKMLLSVVLYDLGHFQWTPKHGNSLLCL